MDRSLREPEEPVVVVMVPLPAQGHLNQLLHFSRILAARGTSVHYIGSKTHNRQAKERVHGWDPTTISNIYFHNFQLPQFINPPPDPKSMNKFPAHLQPAFDASLHLRKPLADLLCKLSVTSKRVVVIHDTLMSFVSQEAAHSIPNAELYAFRSVSMFACLLHHLKSVEKPRNNKGIIVPHDLPALSLGDCFTDQFIEFIRRQYHLLSFTSGELYNTCRPIEGTCIDLLGQKPFLENRKKWAVGPLNPVTNIVQGSSSRKRHKCLDWLDRQPMDSVLYVSFGTMTSISDEQIDEISIGLERSGQRFIWVLREADRGDIYAEEQEGEEIRRVIRLPEGFEERMEGIGVIVRDWAPQLEILAHASTGGFLSHCGWNSCMESMSMGVPIAAWPMHSDQPMNTILVTQILNVGVVVRAWACREKLTMSTDIESAIRKLMVSEEGVGMRARAKELGITVRDAVSEKGSSTAELNSFLDHISRKEV